MFAVSKTKALTPGNVIVLGGLPCSGVKAGAGRAVATQQAVAHDRRPVADLKERDCSTAIGGQNGRGRWPVSVAWTSFRTNCRQLIVRSASGGLIGRATKCPRGQNSRRIAGCACTDMAQGGQNKTTANERTWRTLLFVFSASMAASALLDVEAGRVAGALGDVGVTCLMLSLMHQYPIVRAIIGSASKSEPREQVLREAERLRRAHPWSERIATTGWAMLFSSLILRAIGVD